MRIYRTLPFVTNLKFLHYIFVSKRRLVIKDRERLKSLNTYISQITLFKIVQFYQKSTPLSLYLQVLINRKV